MWLTTVCIVELKLKMNNLLLLLNKEQVEEIDGGLIEF